MRNVFALPADLGQLQHGPLFGVEGAVLRLDLQARPSQPATASQVLVWLKCVAQKPGLYFSAMGLGEYSENPSSLPARYFAFAEPYLTNQG